MTGADRRPQRRGDLLVARDQPFAAIDHEHQQIGGFQGLPALLDDQLVQRILAGAEHARRYRPG